MDLKNKVVMVTGSSLGVGRETAFKFAKEGCKVVVTYFKDKKEGEEVAKKCASFGAADVLLLQLNVMDNKSIKDCVKKTIEKFNHINILINNAGIVIWKQLKEQSFDSNPDYQSFHKVMHPLKLLLCILFFHPHT